MCAGLRTGCTSAAVTMTLTSELLAFYDPVELALLVPVLLATLAGSLIGIERELRHKAAGIGTNILICSAACIFTILSARVDPASQSRIAANILTGIGFIGAGLILRGEKDEQIHGLTTAAGIWMAAAIGMAIGYGYYLLSALGTLVAIWAPRVPHWEYRRRANRIVAQAIAQPSATSPMARSAEEKAAPASDAKGTAVDGRK